MQDLQTPKGFRDFLPAEKRKRDYIAQKIKEVFEQHGFEPLETPTLEYASVLMGKYGEEADRLVYNFEDRGGRRLGMRYDQTVPTARVLAQYRHTLPKYFRRYQMQNVFRAEKPQKGRFREFQQCDIDIFGADSSLADAEIIVTAYRAFQNIGFKNLKIFVNDRELLFSTLKPYATIQVDEYSIIQSIDKLDKKTKDEVIEELVQKGLDISLAQQALSDIEQSKPTPKLKEIIELAVELGVDSEVLVFQPHLARGLDYYTGMIVEVKTTDYPAGSLAGGGRYDKLIEQLGGEATPATGLAFGFDRTVEAAEELGLIPDAIHNSKILVQVFEDQTKSYALNVLKTLRSAGVVAEPYLGGKDGDFRKFFKYADTNKYNLVVIVGESEMGSNKVSLKNMTSGEQKLMSVDEVVQMLG